MLYENVDIVRDLNLESGTLLLCVRSDTTYYTVGKMYKVSESGRFVVDNMRSGFESMLGFVDFLNLDSPAMEILLGVEK